VSRVRFPPAFATGLRHFNAGRFFEAHEAFEDLLDEVDDERWDLLVALIQVAVGYHKATENYPGARRMLRLGAEKLAPFPRIFAGLDVAALRNRVLDDVTLLESGGGLHAPPRLRMRAD
jgi:uncharacterized protein